MNHIFGHATAKAVLHVEMASGESYDVNFDQIHRLDVESGQSIGDYYAPLGTTTLKLTGRVTETVITPNKVPAKPAPKPQKPTVKASAARVRKATVRHAQLTTRIRAAELALKASHVEKEKLDVELKTAREQLLIAAA